MKTITLEGVEYELVPFYYGTPKVVGYDEETGMVATTGQQRGYLLKPTEVTNQSLL